MVARQLPELDRGRLRREAARTVGWVALVWVALLTVYFLLPLEGSRGGRHVVGLVGSVAVFIAATAWQVRRIRAAELPRIRAVSAIGALVPLYLVLFSSIYVAMSNADPSSFSMPLNHVRGLYFTITTVATVGYGDIVAASDGSRLMVSAQMLLNLVLLGSVVRLLAHVARTRVDQADGAPSVEG